MWERPEIITVFDDFRQFGAPKRAGAAALARRSVPPGFARRFSPWAPLGCPSGSINCRLPDGPVPVRRQSLVAIKSLLRADFRCVQKSLARLASSSETTPRPRNHAGAGTPSQQVRCRVLRAARGRVHGTPPDFDVALDVSWRSSMYASMYARPAMPARWSRSWSSSGSRRGSGGCGALRALRGGAGALGGAVVGAAARCAGVRGPLQGLLDVCMWMHGWHGGSATHVAGAKIF
jgi:hypothetical protein